MNLVCNQPTQLPTLSWAGSEHWYAMMLFDREGSRRPGVALAMRHRLIDVSIYGSNYSSKTDKHMANALLRAIHPLTVLHLCIHDEPQR